MSGTPQQADIERLLQHSDWVRGLALRLVGDASRADDLVQETWRAALERPPRHAENLRGWLAAVVRNVARQLGRSDARRATREERASSDSDEPSLDELAARATLQRDVVDHVLALEPELRAVVLLRYFDGHPPREIARRTGVPVKSVHSRISRALDRLRSRLDHEHGDRTAWCETFVAVLALRGVWRASQAPAGAQLGGWMMGLQAKLAATAVVAAAVGIGIWQWSREPAVPTAQDAPVTPTRIGRRTPPPVAGTASGAGEVAERAPVEAPADASRSDGASVAAAPAEAAAVAAPAASRALRVRGRAVDLSGTGVPGVPIALGARPDEVLAESGQDGGFELRLERESAYLQTAGDEFATVCRSSVRWSNSDREHVLIVAPAGELEGLVVDGAGTPLEGAWIGLSLPKPALAGFPYTLDAMAFQRHRVRTDADGRFRLEGFASLPPMQLTATLDGYETEVRTLAAVDPAAPLVLELAPEDEAGRALHGVVLYANGLPAQGAQVRLGGPIARADEAGLFRLPLGWHEPGTPLVAVIEGHQPAVRPDFGAEVEAQGGRPAPVELVLGGPALAIEGRVLDSAGEPCVGWELALDDGTEVSQLSIPVDYVEDMVRGDALSVRTDRDGRFTVDGLADRDYTLRAWDPASLVMVRSDPIPAGTRSAVLRLSATTFRDRLVGRVLTRDGRPLARVLVQVCLNTDETPYGSAWISGQETHTDAEGVFRFGRMPREHVYLRLLGEDILPLELHLDDVADDEEVEVVALRRCRFRIEPADPALPAERVEFERADGSAVSVASFTAGGSSSSRRVEPVDGHTSVLSVAEDASTAVVYRDGVEVDRVPVALDPSAVTVLRL